MKKGVELTLNTIIIAAIGLIALIVIVLTFTDWIEKGNQDLQGIASCQSMGNGQGDCYAEKENCGDCTCIKHGGCPTESHADDAVLCCWPK